MGKRGDIKVSIHPSIHSSFKSPARISLFLPLANMTRRSCTIYVVGITCAVLLAVGIGLFAGQVFRTLMNNRLKKVKGKHTHRYILLPFKAHVHAWLLEWVMTCISPPVNGLIVYKESVENDYPKMMPLSVCLCVRPLLICIPSNSLHTFQHELFFPVGFIAFIVLLVIKIK